MRRLDKYKTFDDARSAFQNFCEDHNYDPSVDCNCPYSKLYGSCELAWAMGDVEDEKN